MRAPGTGAGGRLAAGDRGAPAPPARRVATGTAAEQAEQSMKLTEAPTLEEENKAIGFEYNEIRRIDSTQGAIEIIGDKI